MEKKFTENDNAIELCHIATDDGDWAEVIPETVYMLRKFQEMEQFTVLTGEEQPAALAQQSMIDAFESTEVFIADDGYRLGNLHNLKLSDFNFSLGNFSI